MKLFCKIISYNNEWEKLCNITREQLFINSLLWKCLPSQIIYFLLFNTWTWNTVKMWPEHGISQDVNPLSKASCWWKGWGWLSPFPAWPFLSCPSLFRIESIFILSMLSTPTNGFNSIELMIGWTPGEKVVL